MIWWFTYFFLQVPSAQIVFLAKYITELSLVEYSMLCYAPSLIAASAVFLAMDILTSSKRPWVCDRSTRMILYLFWLLVFCFLGVAGAFCFWVVSDELMEYNFLFSGIGFYIDVLHTLQSFWFVWLCKSTASPVLQWHQF